MTPALAARRYHRDFWLAIAVYVILVFAVPLLLRAYPMAGPTLWTLAIVPALPLLRLIQVIGRYLLETDEYQRALLTRRMLAAIGVTLGACTVWGFLETFAGAPRLDLYLVFPMYCVLYGLAAVFVRAPQ